MPRKVGVENYITHNGDFEFFQVKDKYYDVEVLQSWLEKVLETPMPATVDSGEFALSLSKHVVIQISHHIYLFILFQLLLLE